MCFAKRASSFALSRIPTGMSPQLTAATHCINRLLSVGKDPRVCGNVETQRKPHKELGVIETVNIESNRMKPEL